MTETPKALTDPPEIARTAAPLDLLADVFSRVRLAGAIFLRAEYTAPWAYASPSSGDLIGLLAPEARRLVLFHLVAEGRCWIRVDSGDQLEAGSRRRNRAPVRRSARHGQRRAGGAGADRLAADAPALGDVPGDPPRRGWRPDPGGLRLPLLRRSDLRPGRPGVAEGLERQAAGRTGRDLDGGEHPVRAGRVPGEPRAGLGGRAAAAGAAVPGSATALRGERASATARLAGGAQRSDRRARPGGAARRRPTGGRPTSWPSAPPARARRSTSGSPASSVARRSRIWPTGACISPRTCCETRRWRWRPWRTASATSPRRRSTGRSAARWGSPGPVASGRIGATDHATILGQHLRPGAPGIGDQARAISGRGSTGRPVAIERSVASISATVASPSSSETASSSVPSTAANRLRSAPK